MVAIAMWLFHKHHSNKRVCNTEDTTIDKSRVKVLSIEWEGISNELNVVQQVFEAEQVAHNQAVQNLTTQRAILSNACKELNELKMELGQCLRSNKIQVEKFKELSEDCIKSYLIYEKEEQKMIDMDNEFKKSYADWDVKCEERLIKINCMREKIKTIENQIKVVCS